MITNDYQSPFTSRKIRIKVVTTNSILPVMSQNISNHKQMNEYY